MKIKTRKTNCAKSSKIITKRIILNRKTFEHVNKLEHVFKKSKSGEISIIVAFADAAVAELDRRFAGEEHVAGSTNRRSSFSFAAIQLEIIQFAVLQL